MPNDNHDEHGRFASGNGMSLKDARATANNLHKAGFPHTRVEPHGSGYKAVASEHPLTNAKAGVAGHHGSVPKPNDLVGFLSQGVRVDTSGPRLRGGNDAKARLEAKFPYVGGDPRKK